MCEIFGLLLALIGPIAIIWAIVETSKRSQARKKARRIIPGEKQISVSAINKIIDTLNLTFEKKQRKDLSEENRDLIEKLRRIRKGL